MKRRERVNRDRGEMARKALVKAGYLTGAETKAELTPELLMETAGGFVADVLHLIDSLKGGGGFTRNEVETMVYAARTAFQNDGGIYEF